MKMLVNEENLVNQLREIFARRLYEERARVGVSQATLADHLSQSLGVKVAASAVSRIESRDRAVRLEEAVLMAERIGVPLADLLRERDALDDELDQLRDDLMLVEWRAMKARDVVDTSVEAARSIRRRLAELEGSRGNRTPREGDSAPERPASKLPAS
jgi:transcriptional regulator with XRE-family HTH domain